MQQKDALRNFLDSDLKLTALPAKRKTRMLALRFLASKFEPRRVYSEKEVNAVLNDSCSFLDPATSRRELINNRFFTRSRDCTEYRLNDPQPEPE